jgi:hypothetical protein
MIISIISENIYLIFIIKNLILNMNQPALCKIRWQLIIPFINKIKVFEHSKKDKSKKATKDLLAELENLEINLCTDWTVLGLIHR